MESLNSEQKNNQANYGKRLPFRRVVRYARSMTRYLCAPDSFKESLTAMEAARAMAQGIENADHDAEVRCLPMADGGEGTARALVDATGGSM
ncbi:glycerate kinase, partial [Bifidobacterium longum]